MFGISLLIGIILVYIRYILSIELNLNEISFIFVSFISNLYDTNEVTYGGPSNILFADSPSGSASASASASGSSSANHNTSTTDTQNRSNTPTQRVSNTSDPPITSQEITSLQVGAVKDTDILNSLIAKRYRGCLENSLRHITEYTKSRIKEVIEDIKSGSVTFEKGNFEITELKLEDARRKGEWLMKNNVPASSTVAKDLETNTFKAISTEASLSRAKFSYFGEEEEE